MWLQKAANNCIFFVAQKGTPWLVWLRWFKPVCFASLSNLLSLYISCQTVIFTLYIILIYLHISHHIFSIIKELELFAKWGGIQRLLSQSSYCAYGWRITTCLCHSSWCGGIWADRACIDCQSPHSWVSVPSVGPQSRISCSNWPHDCISDAREHMIVDSGCVFLAIWLYFKHPASILNKSHKVFVLGAYCLDSVSNNQHDVA